MAIKIAHSSIDENGKAIGGAAGDQNKKEVCTRTYYNGSWNAVLRPKSADIAEKSAKFMEAACVNDNIGYDQGQRNTLFEQAKKVNFDCSKIVVKCECDCSSLIHVAVIAAGAKLTYGSNGFTTRTMVNKLVASGDYEKLTDSKYLTSDKYLKRGDILVKEGSHCVMALENGSGVATVAPKPSATVSAPTLKAGQVVYLSNTAVYGNASTASVSSRKTGTFYLWDDDVVNGRVKITNRADRVGKAGQVTGWMNVADITGYKPATTTNVSIYYPKYSGKETNLDAILKAVGVPAKYTGNYKNRTPLAQANGISNYAGTYMQNKQLGTLAKQGKLKKV